MKYPPVKCACGRILGSNVFRQHGRKCPAQLRAWAHDGAAVHLLDERPPAAKAADPIVQVQRWSLS